MDMSLVESDRLFRVTPAMAGVRISPGEFDNVREWDEDYDYELVQGVLVVVPPVSEAERDRTNCWAIGCWFTRSGIPWAILWISLCPRA